MEALALGGLTESLVGLLKQVCFWQMQLLKKSFLADEPNFSMRSTRGDVQSTAACRRPVVRF
jgi:hypothetical protein